MRVPRTFVFVDISDFTRFTAEQGDDAAARLLTAWRGTTRDTASETGVRIDKWLGDGCMIVAVEQLDALVFALELRRRAAIRCAPLKMRMGIASGLALLFDGNDYIGSSVNLAARLCDSAGVDEVLMPADHIVQLPDGVSALAHRPLSLRGLSTPVEVVVLDGEPVITGREDNGELWTRSPFVT
ncbi:MAG: adenylate/guanylate cyclase domain-containing protein [Actinobacteria bacterium]|nr:adenylate/guanylate cyclase domain-containing protein [Actinomycetota bacterium]